MHYRLVILETVRATCNKIVIRGTNWLGDAVISLPASRAIRDAFPRAHLAVVARPWVADLYSREPAIDRIIVYPGRRWTGNSGPSVSIAPILLQNVFEAALVAAGGYSAADRIRSDGRGWRPT